MDRYTNLGEAKAGLKRVRRHWSEETMHNTKVLMLVLQELRMIHQELATQRVTKPKKQKTTEWQRFFGRGMKAGKPPKQIAAEWRTRRS